MFRFKTVVIFIALSCCGPAFSQYLQHDAGLQSNLDPGESLNILAANKGSDSFGAPVPIVASKDFLLKLAYGKTFGTSTELDYATFELSRRLSAFPALTYWGPAVGEVQIATLASYVVYYEGNTERVKKLDFRDGYELAWLPKGRFTFPNICAGMSPYLESGAGLSYVSETYRNSGSRWNWSFLGGFGFERAFCGSGAFSIGVQWRHLSNGNMWGKGDELHNSNSGTDMIQGLATFIKEF
jgi:hypothetical protein